MEDNAEPDSDRECQSLSKKSEKRVKILKTAVMYMSYFGLGMCQAIPGPTLLDFMGLIGATVEQISWGIALFSLGFLLGACGAGYLVERMKPLGILSIITLSLAVTSSLVPVMPNLASHITINFLWGFSCGMLETVVNVILVRTWKEENGPYMQGLHFTAAIGSTIAPLLVEPFLGFHSQNNSQDVETNSSAHGEISSGNISYHSYSSINITSGFGFSNKTMSNITSSNSSVGVTVTSSSTCSSKIHISFLLIGLWCFLTFLSVIILLVKTKNTFKQCLLRKPAQESEKKNRLNNKQHKRKRLRILILALTFLFYFFYIFVEELFADFVAIFVVNQLNWTKSSAALLCTVYWGSFCIMGGAAIIISRFLSPRQMQTANLAISIMAVLLIITAVTKFPIVMWPASALLGGGFASIFPTQISRTEEHTEFTGLVSSIILTGSSIGGLMTGPLIGHLVKVFSYMITVYILAAMCLGCALTFIVLELAAKQMPPKSKSDEIEKTELKEEEMNCLGDSDLN